MTTKMLEQLRKMNERGLCDREMADRLGVNEKTVYYWRRKKLGLSPSYARLTYTVYDGKTTQFLVEGTVRQCADFLGLSKDTIRNYRWRTKHGIRSKYEVYSGRDLTDEGIL